MQNRRNILFLPKWYPCEEDVQCSAMLLTGGACVLFKCGCVAGKHYHDGVCWVTKGECDGIYGRDSVTNF